MYNTDIMKITLERSGVYVTIRCTHSEDEVLENIGFASLGKIAEESLNKICSKMESSDCDEYYEDDEADDEDDEEDDEADDEEDDEEDDDDDDEDDEDDEEDDDDDDDDDEDEEDDEEDDDEEEDNEEEENEDKEEEDKENDDKEVEEKTKCKVTHSKVSRDCFKCIKTSNKDKLIKLVKGYNGKIKVYGTSKEQRSWVYKIVSEIENIDAWSLSLKNHRVLVLDYTPEPADE